MLFLHKYHYYNSCMFVPWLFSNNIYISSQTIVNIKKVHLISSHTTDTATRRWSTWSGAVSCCPVRRTVRRACTQWWWSVGTRRRCDVHTSLRYTHAYVSGQGLHHHRLAVTAPTAHSSLHTDLHTRTSWLSGSRPPTTRLLPTYEPLNVVLAITVSAKLGCKLLFILR